MVRKSENLKKSEKSLLFKNSKLLKKKIVQEKKSLFLITRTTQFDQSSPVRPDPKKKISKISKNYLKTTTTKNSILLVFQY